MAVCRSWVELVHGSKCWLLWLKHRLPKRKGCDCGEAQYSPGRNRKKKASHAILMVARWAWLPEAVAVACAWSSNWIGIGLILVGAGSCLDHAVYRLERRRSSAPKVLKRGSGPPHAGECRCNL